VYIYQNSQHHNSGGHTFCTHCSETLRVRKQTTLVKEFYIHGSVHRDSILINSNEMQQYAGVYLLQIYSTYFGCLSHPSSGLHQIVTAASGTDHITCQSNNLPPAWPN